MGGAAGEPGAGPAVHLLPLQVRDRLQARLPALLLVVLLSLQRSQPNECAGVAVVQLRAQPVHQEQDPSVHSPLPNSSPAEGLTLTVCLICLCVVSQHRAPVCAAEAGADGVPAGAGPLPRSQTAPVCLVVQHSNASAARPVVAVRLSAVCSCVFVSVVCRDHIVEDAFNTLSPQTVC